MKSFSQQAVEGGSISPTDSCHIEQPQLLQKHSSGAYITTEQTHSNKHLHKKHLGKHHLIKTCERKPKRISFDMILKKCIVKQTHLKDNTVRKKKIKLE